MKTTLHKSKKMKKALVLLLLCCGMANAQLTFADPALKAYLLSSSASNSIAMNSSFQSVKIDADSNGQIDASEAAVVVKLWIEDATVTSLGGIEGFANLGDLGVKQTGIASSTLPALPNLVNLTFLENASLTYLNVSGAPALVQLSASDNPQLAGLITLGCNGLGTVVAQHNALVTMDLSGFTNLQNVYLDYNALTSINVAGCTNLSGITASNNQLTMIVADGLANLVAMNLSDNPNLNIIHAAGCSSLQGNIGSYFTNDNNITYADFTDCTSLTVCNFPNNNLDTLIVSGCTALTNIMAANNHLTTLEMTGCTALTSIDCQNNQLTALDLSGFINLQYLTANDNDLAAIALDNTPALIAVNVTNNPLLELVIEDHTALTTLQYGGTGPKLLDTSGCTALSQLTGDYQDIENIDISNCTALTSFTAISMLTLQSLKVSGCSALTDLNFAHDFGNSPINTIDLSGLTNLKYLTFGGTHIAALDLSDCVNLIQLTADVNQISQITFPVTATLTNINLNTNQLQNIDVSMLSNLQSLNVSANPPLEAIYAKNGAVETIGVGPFSNPALHFICQDESAIASTVTTLNAVGFAPGAVVCNSYCTFTPGGNYNTITGTIHYDLDNNGCDAADLVKPNIRVDIADGGNSGATFTDSNGNYTFYTGAGSFDLSQSIENAAIFNFSPTTATIPFADANNNTATQNFCISANGVHNDVEIVIAPIHPARPGFVAVYQIVIRNKGNQTQSGSFNFAYDDSRLDFSFATLAPDSQSTGLLSWNYANLLPFESRSLLVIMNVNSPTQTPPVNVGDILTLTATINPIVGDMNPADNQFIFNEEVIGSYDPNNITCIEGETVPPTEIGNYLHYIVNFENTGTAEAENIVVRLDIDPAKYDIGSLQMLNASHANYTRITGNTIEFIFEGINLSVGGNPPVGGHGNVLFKIKSDSGLSNGDSVTNAAKIFFDYNAPVATNDAETTFALLSNPIHEFDDSIRMYPNPAHSVVNISCASAIKSIELYDIQGRILERAMESSNETTLDISGRQAGVYFLKITTDRGSKVQKIIKE